MIRASLAMAPRVLFAAAPGVPGAAMHTDALLATEPIWGRSGMVPLIETMMDASRFTMMRRARMRGTRWIVALLVVAAHALWEALR